jgi:hypothetical protein
MRGAGACLAEASPVRERLEHVVALDDLATCKVRARARHTEGPVEAATGQGTGLNCPAQRPQRRHAGS